jgi:DNA-binding CsgD family transcriptional regulator
MDLDQPAPGEAPAYAESMALVRNSLWNGDQQTFLSALGALTTSSKKIDQRTTAVLTLAAQWHFGPTYARPDDHGTQTAASADPWSHTAATLADVWKVAGNDSTTASAERILRNCPLDDTTLEALATAITALAHGGQGERAEYWYARLSEQADRREATTWQALIGGVWSGVILRRGEIAGAASLARSSLNLLGTQSWGVSMSYPLTTLLIADTAAGAFDAAAKTLGHPVPKAMFHTAGGLRYLRARGRYHLATDCLLAAISDFMECRRLMDEQNTDFPALVPWRSDLAEAYLRFGNAMVARELANQQLERSAETDMYARGLALRVLALAAPASESPALMAQAADCFKRSGDLLETTRTLKLLGSNHPGTGWNETVRVARVPQQRVWRAPLPDVVAPLHEIDQWDDDFPGPDDPLESMVLSEAELRVAQQAALGQTNRQIGGSLFITVSTVEQHLTRVYRKLGISGRSELPTQLIVPA